jgi:hypothetical protein
MIYILWKADGTGEDIVSDKPLELEQMQKLVGGYIEMVWRGEPYKSHCFMVNEDGRSMGLPVNAKFPELVGNVLEGQMIIEDEEYQFVGF